MNWYDYNCRNMDPHLYSDNSGNIESFIDEPWGQTPEREIIVDKS